MANLMFNQNRILLKALFIRDVDGKPLHAIKRVAITEALNIWNHVEESLLRVRQVTYFEDLEGWVVVVQRLG